MHARIRTWFPFAIQIVAHIHPDCRATRICLNGREWLARTTDAVGLGSVRRDNCFMWLEDPHRAQQPMDQQVQAG